MNVALPIKAASPEELIQRANDMVPSLRERAASIAENRSVPSDIMKEMYDAGLMEVMRPKKFGGPEYGPDVVTKIGKEIGKGDGATSWVYLVTAAHDAFVPLFPEKVQAEYWNSERPVGASSYMPTGKATPADGGFVLNGKWSFCSGIDHSGWVLLGAVVGMLENPTRPDMRYYLLDDSQFKIVDDWYHQGLQGTGSKSVEVDNVFVPNERMITFGQIIAGVALGPDADKHPDYKESVWVAVGYSLAAPAIGIAQAAYDAVVKDLKARFARHDPVFEARRLITQAHLAEAGVIIDAADLLFTNTMNRTFGRLNEYQRLTNEERVINRRDVCYAVKMCIQAVDKLMGISGASGMKLHHPVQRALRDLYAIASHPGVSFDSPAMSFGSVELGGMPTEPSI